MHRTTRPSLTLCVALLALSLTVPGSGAADWARWLGPTQDGRVAGLGLAPGKTVGLEVAWKRSLGLGYTGIALADGRAVTMFADGTKDWVVALDPSTGAERWRYEIGEMFPARGGSEGGPNSFPVVHDGIVYGLSAAGNLFAVQARDGTEQWKLRIDEKFGARPPMFGFSTVPLVVGDILFVQAGGDEGRGLVGLDRGTGELRFSVADERAGYGSPILATLGGVQQIVAHTNVAVYGIDPEDGKVLWRHEHGMVEGEGAESIGTPVLIGGDRFFLNGEAASKAFVVKHDGGAWQVEEAWSTRAMKGSLATPVFHEDHLYGFDGDFLTCIRAEDGAKVWKSRPPGGRGLILIDGQLLIFANDGSMVAVEATPDRYRETGRLDVTDAGSYTYPSFSDGLVFVRNTREVAAIAARPLDASAAVSTAAVVAPRNPFEKFILSVQNSNAKPKLVDQFMSAQTTFPVVEDGWVHFVYRGQAEDVAISGSMTEYQVEDALQRVEGTDLFYRSYAIDAPTRWEYRFNVDFENPQPDPLNPRRIATREGELSEVTAGGWKASPWLEPYSGSAAGRVDHITLASEILGNERSIDVYLPAGYDDGQGRYPLVVATDGQGWNDLGHLPNVLDHLSGDAAASVIVAFVQQPEGAQAELGGPKTDDYARMIVDELVPRLDATYRTLPRADARAILGAGTGGTVAVVVALERPEVFGKVAATSVYLGSAAGQKLPETIEAFDAEATRPVFVVSWNRDELRRTDWNVDIGQDTRRLVQMLQEHGFQVDASEAVDAAGWGAWPVRAGEMLVALFPPS